MLGELDLIIGSDRVKRHKPDPEGLLAAMSRLGAGPEETLFCGDTVLDAGRPKMRGQSSPRCSMAPRRPLPSGSGPMSTSPRTFGT